MKLFLLLTSFLFNVTTWALVDIEDNGHDIQSPLSNLHSSVADDVSQVILTSNEVTVSTDGSTCLVKLVKFCISTWDHLGGKQHEYEFYINGSRYYPSSGYKFLDRGCHSFQNTPVTSIPAGKMTLKTIEKDIGFLDKDDIATAEKAIPSSCAGGPLRMKTSEGNTAVFELYAPPTASPTSSPSSSPTPVPTPSPTKCIKWCSRQVHLRCHPFQKCPHGYWKAPYNPNIGNCYWGTKRFVCQQNYQCPC